MVHHGHAARPAEAAGQPPAKPLGGHCAGVSAVFGGLLEALLAEKAKDGVLPLDEALRVVRRLTEGTEHMRRVYASQEDRCRRALLGARGNATARSNPFRRLMVRPFETLLDGSPAVFPRPLLGNYFTVLGAAFGDKLDDYDKLCRSVFQVKMVEHGHSLTWEHFYSDQRIGQVLHRALHRLTRFIDSPAGQWVWLQHMTQGAGRGPSCSPEQLDQVIGTLRSTLAGYDLTVDAAAKA